MKKVVDTGYEPVNGGKFLYSTTRRHLDAPKIPYMKIAPPFSPITQMAGFFVLSGILISPCHGLHLRNFSATAHLRMNGFPSNPSINPTFLNPSGVTDSRLDLTGVGWSVQDLTKQFTLVSPRHFVGANHFRPAIGSNVRFLAKDGSLHTFTVATISAIPNANGSASDLFLGEFTSELSGVVPVLPLPYLNLPTEAAYVGEALVVVGQNARGGRGVIAAVQDFGGNPITGGAGIQTRAFTFTYALAAGGNDDAYAESGDSGSPSFALRSGKAALVGTHTAVATALGTVRTFDTLVPHYVPELNSRMEVTGLRMRKVNPAATSFSASGAPVQTTVRALAPFAFGITITNGANEAENLVANLTQGSNFGIPEISAAGWFSPASSIIRLGGLGAGVSSQVGLAFAAAPGSGETSVSLTLKSDGSANETFLFPLTVLPSFAEWAVGLNDISLGGDSDKDGISNLLEYAFGGDNTANSLFFPNGENTALLPRFAASPNRLSFIRRTDAGGRGLSYVIETSTTLEPGSWQVVADAALSVISSPGPGFEEISAALPTTAAERRFYRMRIDLNE